MHDIVGLGICGMRDHGVGLGIYVMHDLILHLGIWGITLGLVLAFMECMTLFKLLLILAFAECMTMVLPLSFILFMTLLLRNA